MNAINIIKIHNDFKKIYLKYTRNSINIIEIHNEFN